jgi:microcystin-dependent protein
LIDKKQRKPTMSEPFIAEVKIFAGNFAPRSWAFCDGQLLPIAQNQALFSLVGTIYGGDGRTTFALPDLRGRVPVHPGRGPGLTDYQLGERGGAETVTLTTNQMPQHTHSVSCSANDATLGLPAGNFPATTGDNVYSQTSDATMNSGMLSSVGGSQPHENRQPYLAINFVIALQGIYPSRN